MKLTKKYIFTASINIIPYIYINDFETAYKVISDLFKILEANVFFLCVLIVFISRTIY